MPKINNKKLRIAFIDPASICEKYPFPAVNPLGLCYIAEMSKQQGHIIRVFQKLDINIKDFVQKIIDFNPDICAFSVFTTNFNFSLKLAGNLKNKLNCLIIFGGSHPTGDPTIVKNKAIDFNVIGEAEDTFSELLNFIINKKNNFDQIKGISFKKNEQIIITKPRDRIKDLDSLPFPYFAGLPRDRYKRVSSVIPIAEQKFAGVLSSRGCPFSCRFCLSPALWQKQIYFRNPKKVVDEIEILTKKYQINTIRFLDNDFLINQKHAFEVCDELVKRKIKISWGCFGSLRNVSSVLLQKMKSAGCAEIYYGIESLKQKNLNKQNKKLLIKDIVNGLKKTEKAGLLISGGIIIGYPEETEKDLIFLNKIVHSMPIDRLELAFLTPYPGTALAKTLKPNQYLTKNLEDFNNQIPIIKTSISLKKLLFWQKKIYLDFYNSKEYKKTVLRKIKKYPETINFYNNLFEWLNKDFNLKNTKKELKINSGSFLI